MAVKEGAVMRKGIIIAVDFDGTLCENKYPEIGTAKSEIVNYLKVRKIYGDKLILWSCRVDEKLNEAVEWCKDKGLEFDAVNENLPEVIEAFGNDTRKIYADIYLDDRAIMLKIPKAQDHKKKRKEPETEKLGENTVIDDYID